MEANVFSSTHVNFIPAFDLSFKLTTLGAAALSKVHDPQCL